MSPYFALQLSTKLLDSNRFKDSLKLVYDFQNRFGEYSSSCQANSVPATAAGVAV